MIGALIDRIRPSRTVVRDGDSLLLTCTEFHRELVRERIRSTRRAFPFCVLTFDLIGRENLVRRRRILIRLLHRNLRLTDQKAQISTVQFAALLVDTPEMGGRCVLDRLSNLCQSKQLSIKLSLQVHDPQGFDPEDDRDLPSNPGDTRRIDRVTNPWTRVDSAAQESAYSLDIGQHGQRGLGATAIDSEGPVSISTETRRIDRLDLAEGPQVPIVTRRRVSKRVVDLVGASIGLMITSPIIVCAAIAVKITSVGPVFFKQTREGMNGQPFTIYKMRTMELDAEAKQAELVRSSHRDGPAFKIKRDPRVTTVGNFLRKTCIDELPQFINVIKGDMSLVGPRPLPWKESRACDHWHRRRLDVPPGMTCYWQVDKAAADTFDDWMRMDLRYVDRNGILQDLRLIALTFLVPLTGRGSE